MGEAEEGVGPSSVHRIDGRADRPVKQERIFHEEGGGRRGGPAGPLRRAAEGDLLPGGRLVERFEHAGEVDRNQQQIERINPEEVGRSIADPRQIPGIEEIVGERGQGKPERPEAPLERKGEEKEQGNVGRGNGNQIMAADKPFSQPGPAFRPVKR